METSRRAVESYWRSRMIDAATSDEDKVTPVYKLEEICELLRTSTGGIVKEVSDFVLKRLDHKSPVVKQKALRIIKYAVGKSGPEFRREMQRHSVAVKQLLHYKGQPDPLKGDALNKAVRETAQDALSAIFSTEDQKPAPVNEVTHKRMEGFGNTNYVMPPAEKKSFISEVVGIGSASIKQGLSNLAQAHSNSFKKNETGSYRGPTLQRSLTIDSDHSDRYQKMDYHGGNQGTSGLSRNVTSGPWGKDSVIGHAEATNGDATSSHFVSKSQEERLLETIVTSGGVRLQPTRDALQAFLVEASKMDALALSQALESKLQSPHWQVRTRAVCVLEAALRMKEDEHFDFMASYFSEHIDVVVRCSESPQASLREKATRVLNLLNGGQTGTVVDRPTKSERTMVVVEMPNLIDTGDNDLLGAEDLKGSQVDNAADAQLSSVPLIDDLFGDSISGAQSASDHRTDDDPFADVSFYNGEDKDQGTDLFTRMTVGENSTAASTPALNTVGADPFDFFGSSEPPKTLVDHANSVNNLMAGLSMSGDGLLNNEKGTSPAVLSESLFMDSNMKHSSEVQNSSLSTGFDSKLTGINTNAMFPVGAVPYSIPPGMMYNQFYPAQAVNYAAMGGLLSQQQLMAAMANLQSLGNLSSQNAATAANASVTVGHSAFPDIFNASLSTKTPTVTMNNSKEETRAFDFISDHIASARDPKKVL